MLEIFSILIFLEKMAQLHNTYFSGFYLLLVDLMRLLCRGSKCTSKREEKGSDSLFNLPITREISITEMGEIRNSQNQTPIYLTFKR